MVHVHCMTSMSLHVSEEDEASSVACINGVTLRHMVHVRGQPFYGRCLNV